MNEHDEPFLNYMSIRILDIYIDIKKKVVDKEDAIRCVQLAIFLYGNVYSIDKLEAELSKKIQESSFFSFGDSNKNLSGGGGNRMSYLFAIIILIGQLLGIASQPIQMSFLQKQRNSLLKPTFLQIGNLSSIDFQNENQNKIMESLKEILPKTEFSIAGIESLVTSKITKGSQQISTNFKVDDLKDESLKDKIAKLTSVAVVVSTFYNENSNHIYYAIGDFYDKTNVIFIDSHNKNCRVIDHDDSIYDDILKTHKIVEIRYFIEDQEKIIDTLKDELGQVANPQLNESINSKLEIAKKIMQTSLPKSETDDINSKILEIEGYLTNQNNNSTINSLTEEVLGFIDSHIAFLHKDYKYNAYESFVESYQTNYKGESYAKLARFYIDFVATRPIIQFLLSFGDSSSTKMNSPIFVEYPTTSPNVDIRAIDTNPANDSKSISNMMDLARETTDKGIVVSHFSAFLRDAEEPQSFFCFGDILSIFSPDKKNFLIVSATDLRIMNPEDISSQKPILITSTIRITYDTMNEFQKEIFQNNDEHPKEANNSLIVLNGKNNPYPQSQWLVHVDPTILNSNYSFSDFSWETIKFCLSILYLFLFPQSSARYHRQEEYEECIEDEHDNSDLRDCVESPFDPNQSCVNLKKDAAPENELLLEDCVASQGNVAANPLASKSNDTVNLSPSKSIYSTFESVGAFIDYELQHFITLLLTKEKRQIVYESIFNDFLKDDSDKFYWITEKESIQVASMYDYFHRWLEYHLGQKYQWSASSQKNIDLLIYSYNLFANINVPLKNKSNDAPTVAAATTITATDAIIENLCEKYIQRQSTAVGDIKTWLQESHEGTNEPLWQVLIHLFDSLVRRCSSSVAPPPLEIVDSNDSKVYILKESNETNQEEEATSSHVYIIK